MTARVAGTLAKFATQIHDSRKRYKMGREGCGVKTRHRKIRFFETIMAKTDNHFRTINCPLLITILFRSDR